MPAKKQKLVVIDSNALVHRAFHALPPSFTDEQGRPTNAVYGFTAIFLKAIKDLKPDYLAACFDRKEKTFRHEEYEQYKATRIKAPDELYQQIPLVKKVLTAFGVPIFELAGFEADDLIGTICELKTVDRPDIETIILTGDQDCLQLVDYNTKVLAPHKGMSETFLYDETGVKEKFGGLSPKQLIDYKGLRGDLSDNIPGVKGIGEKGAIELLTEFGSLENIYKNIDSKKIKDRTRELLKSQRQNAVMSKGLATIVRSAPIDFKLADCRFAGFDQNAVVDVFSELGFKRLMSQIATLAKTGMIAPAGQKSLFSVSSRGSEATVGIPSQIEKNSTHIKYGIATFRPSGFARNDNPRLGKQDYELVTEKTLKKFLLDLKQQEIFCFDTETTGLDPFTTRLVGISFSWQAGEAFYLPVDLADQIKPELSKIFDNNKIKKIGHNLKFDLEIINRHFNVKTAGFYFDTMVASYVLNPGHRQHNLDTLAFVEFGYQMQPIEELIGKPISPNWKEQGQNPITLAHVPVEEVAWYSGEDADLTFRLYEKFSTELEKENLKTVFYDVEMPLIEVLSAIEKNGVKINDKFLNKLSAEFGQKIKAIEKKAWKLAGQEFNLASPKQLKEVLFDKLKISAAGISKTKTGLSTAAGELEKLSGQHKIIDLIMEFRELSKLKSTYLDALPTLINPLDKRVHTSFNQTVTATGRLSSSEPNLQNIPIRTEIGGQIRKAFIAEKGNKILKADYSQIELRIIASLANDKQMFKIFNSGGDIHTMTAALINGIKPSEVTKEIRRTAKEINFGIIYGMGAWGLSSRTGLSNTEAQKFIYKYFETFSGVKKWLDETVEIARDKEYVETFYGRKRYLPEINSNISQVRNSAERMAVNMPIQGCLPRHVKILTSGGYRQIGDLYSDNKKPKLVWDGESWKKYKVLNRGKAQLAKITLSNGQTLDCDVRHEVLCLDNDGYFWKKFTELELNDKICFSFPEIKNFKESLSPIKYNYNKNRQRFKIENIHSDFWYWIGYYYGDGHFSKRKTTRAVRYDFSYAFGNQEEKKLQKCENYFSSLGLNPRRRKLPPSTPRAQDKWELTITSVGWGNFLEHFGVKSNENAKTKRILNRVFQESKENRIAFIKGFFEADGCLGKNYKYMPNFHLCQKEILSDLQILLRTLGVESSLLGPYEYKGGISFRLDMLRNSFRKNIYGEKIKESYRTACKTPQFIINEIIKKYPRLTRKNLKTESDYVLYNRWKNGGCSTVHQIKSWLRNNNLIIESPLYSWYRIKKLWVDTISETTYTLSVEHSHRFDSEGVISKNTAADLIKLAMIAIQNDLEKISANAKMILQVHDELVFEVPENDIKKVAEFVREKMTGAMKLRAPIEAELSVGDNWGETKTITN